MDEERSQTNSQTELVLIPSKQANAPRNPFAGSTTTQTSSPNASNGGSFDSLPVPSRKPGKDFEEIRIHDNTPSQIEFPITASYVYGNVAYLGLAFSFIFTGYHVAQSFVTTMYHSAGFATLGVIYVTFAISSLFAPLINNLLENKPGAGEKLTMLFSGITYVIFILGLYTGSTTFVLVGGFIKGAGSGLLWISQGVWLTKLVNAYRAQERASIASSAPGKRAPSNIVGISTGIFFTIFNLNAIVGNLIVIALMKSGCTVQTMILAMSIVTALGTVLISFSINAPIQNNTPRPSDASSVETLASQDVGDSRDTVNTAVKKVDVNTIVGRLKAIFNVAGKVQTIYLTPYLLCQGVNMAYNYGNFPTFIRYVNERISSSPSPEEAATDIAYAFLAYGVGSMIGSVAWGKLYDVFNSMIWPLLIIHFVLVSTCFSVLTGTVTGNIEVQYLSCLLILIAFLFGSVDFLTNAIINNSITRNYGGKDVSVAFSWYRFCYCIGFAVASGVSSLLPSVDSYSDMDATTFERYGWLVMVFINVGIMVISVLAGYILEFKTVYERQKPDRNVGAGMH